MTQASDTLFNHIINVFDGEVIGRNCWDCTHNSLGSLTLFGICNYNAKWGKGPPIEITPELVKVGCNNYRHKNDKGGNPQVELWGTNKSKLNKEKKTMGWIKLGRVFLDYNEDADETNKQPHMKGNLEMALDIKRGEKLSLAIWINKDKGGSIALSTFRKDDEYGG